MLIKKILKSRIGEKGITQVIENAYAFNREKFPVKIKEIGLGGSALRTERPRDIDIVVRAEFESNFNQNPDSIEYLKRAIRERLSRDWQELNLDFHIFTPNPSLSDRWIPSLTVWSCRDGYVEINPYEVERLYINEFRELSAIVEKIKGRDEYLPPFFRHSINLMKSQSRNKVDVEFKNYLNRELNEMVRMRKSRGEIPLSELNTLLRTKMKKFGFAGCIHSEIRKGLFEKQSRTDLLRKFTKYGFSEEIDSILNSLSLDFVKN